MKVSFGCYLAGYNISQEISEICFVDNGGISAYQR